MTPGPQIITTLPALPARPADMHKGQAGRVALIAGSRDMSGAAVLSGLGALRGGAGLVRICCPRDAQPVIAASEPCLMTAPLEVDGGLIEFKSSLPTLSAAQDWADALAIGPGLGSLPYTHSLVRSVYQLFRGPLVLDADALNHAARAEWPLHWWLGREGQRPAAQPRPVRILTPHPGEMVRLRAGLGLPDREFSSDAERLTVAYEFARLTETLVVLKGRHTVVVAGERAFVNQTGNAGMASGGMGDVLTGLLAALLARGRDPFEAACLAVHLHGRAADRVAERVGPWGYLAREVADELPGAIRELVSESGAAPRDAGQRQSTAAP